MSDKTPWGNKKDPGAYGHLMINDTVGSLPDGERQEYRRLVAVKRKSRTLAQQTRLEELWRLGSKLRQEWRAEQKNKNDQAEREHRAFVARMWAKQGADSAAPGPASS